MGTATAITAPKVTTAGPPRTTRRGAGALWGAAVGVTVAVLTVLRLVVAGDGLDRVWAEDGFVFLWDAQRYGSASLFYVYAGYAHTLPRGWGLVAAQLPLEHFAVFAVLATALCAGVLAAVVFSIARRVTGSPAWALLPALALAVAPAFRGSVGSLANLQWLLLVVAFWCVIDRTGNRWVPAGTALLAALTTPLTVLLLPAALLAHREGILRSWSVRALAAGLIVQAGLIAFGGASEANPAVRNPGIPQNLFSQALSAATGTNVAPLDLGRLGVLDVSLLLGAVFAGVLLLAVWETRGRQPMALAALLTGAALFAGTSLMSGAPTTRYAAAAAMFFISALALAGPHLPRLLQRAGLTVLAVNVVLAFPASDFRLSGPSWEAEVQRYQDSCRETGEPTAIALSPDGWGQIRLHCSK